METITRKHYETDLTDDEWAIPNPSSNAPSIATQPKHAHTPDTTPLREITNAILYILKTGCQWRQLPHDLPP
jgi:transposase